MKLFLVAFSVVVVTGYALAAGKTCQTQCYMRGKSQMCTHYCWP
jgi:hypothetical protein